MDISAVNKLTRNEFIKKFGNIVECFPRAASELYPSIPFKNIADIITKVHLNLDNLRSTDKETILKSHPDLAGKLADEGKLTKESTEEQKAAGLDKLSPEAKRELNQLNIEYKQKFGFPFVICARENKAESILHGLRTRLKNTKQEELETGMQEVKKICKLRIENIVNTE